MDQVVILAGMHRSGTSFFSSILEKAGVDMGSELLQASADNVKVHFENLNFLNFHMKVLLDQGLNDSGFITQSCNISDDYIPEAKAIINKNKKAIWGWKEPRTTLFLDFWNNLLPNAKYIFVYRDPWEVVDSLFRRGDVLIQQNPTEAIQIWTLYNKLMLNFYLKHKDKSVLVHTNELMSNPKKILEFINNKFSLDLNLQIEYSFEDKLYTTFEKDNIRKNFIKSTQPESINILEELNSNSGYKPNQEKNISIPNSTDNYYIDWFASKQLEKIKKLFTKEELSSKGIYSILSEQKSHNEKITEDYKNLQVNYEKYRNENEILKNKLEQSNNTLTHISDELTWIKNSKFWKIREIWVTIRLLFK